MYECQSCGVRFTEPAYYYERRGDYGLEEIVGCPICGGGYIELPEGKLSGAVRSWHGLYMSMLSKGWGNDVAEQILNQLMSAYEGCEEPPRAAQIIVECMPERQEMRA